MNFILEDEQIANVECSSHRRKRRQSKRFVQQFSFAARHESIGRQLDADRKSDRVLYSFDNYRRNNCDIRQVAFNRAGFKLNNRKLFSIQQFFAKHVAARTFDIFFRYLTFKFPTFQHTLPGIIDQQVRNRNF